VITQVDFTAVAGLWVRERGRIFVELVTKFLEEPSKLGPYGAKGIAEIVLVPTAPAILNAVTDAIGIRFTKIPLTAEEVLGKLSEKK